jgi:hypothetical protein
MLKFVLRKKRSKFDKKNENLLSIVLNDYIRVEYWLKSEGCMVLSRLRLKVRDVKNCE